MNMGAFSYLAPRLATALNSIGRGKFEDLKYVGRPPAAATATGFGSVHQQEQRELAQKAMQHAPIKFIESFI